MTWSKRIMFSVALMAFITVLILAIGESAVRVILYFKYAQKTGASMLILDDVLGWCITPSFVFRGSVVDKAKNKYPVSINVDETGGRWMRTGSTNGVPCVLFVGDSFTMAIDASDEKTYYAWIAKNLAVNAVAYSGGGYGTCQEYLMIDRYLDRVRPVLVVLQLCDNDFINNSCELESLSKWNNNSMRRPYFDEKGGLFYAMPGGFPRAFPRLRMFVNKHSCFLYFVFSRIDRSCAASRGSIEEVIARKGRAFPPYEQSVRITASILEMFRRRVPKEIPVVAFCVDGCAEWRSICSQSGIHLIEGLSEAVARAEKDGQCVRAADGAHWNENGHKVAGEYLALKIKALADPPFSLHCF